MAIEGKGVEAVVNYVLLAIGVLLIGLAVGYFVALLRLKPKMRLHQDQLTIKELTLDELRHESSEDKKTNRKLRYQLAQHDRLSSGQDSGNRKLDDALAEVRTLTVDLVTARRQLAERDDAMRFARITIKEIRQQIEGSGAVRISPGSELAPTEAEFVEERLASLEDVTGEINLQR